MLKSTPAQLQARLKYYEKNNELIKKQHANYYQTHKETLKEKRRLRYQAKKARELLENPIPKVRKPRSKKIQTLFNSKKLLMRMATNIDKIL